MFGTILNTAVALMHAYVFWRAGSAAYIKQHVPGKVILAAAIVFYLMFLLGREYGRGGNGLVSVALELFIMNWMAAIFLITIIMLGADIVTGFGFLLPRIAPVVRLVALASGVGLSLIGLVQGMRPPVVKHYEVILEGLPAELDGTVAVAVSDTHFGSLIGRRWGRMLIDRIHAQRPDIILLVGDIFDGHGLDREGVIPVLRSLTAPMGVWAVLGNHDSFRRGTAEYYNEAGYNLLRNEWREVSPGLVLAGVDNLSDRGYEGRDNPVEKTLEGLPESGSIFLTHKPLQSELASSRGVDLMLSGHTHGGQVWPFGQLVKRRYNLFAGQYDVGGMTAIVSRGAGTWGPRMRLWYPGEILRIKLLAP